MKTGGEQKSGEEAAKRDSGSVADYMAGSRNRSISAVPAESFVTHCGERVCGDTQGLMLEMKDAILLRLRFQQGAMHLTSLGKL